jgi:hypothetical protein
VQTGGRGLRRNPLDLLLIVEFTVIVFAVYIPGQLGSIGVDSATYWDAAHRWIGGQDPYANLGGLVFAAPPPTLLVLAPFALLPLQAFQVVELLASIVATVFLLQRLRLPFWYVLFPPVVEALLTGNPNVIVVALLVLATPLSDAIATFLKLYAVLPVALLGRTRSLVAIVVLLVVSAPFLPWTSYINHAAELVQVLNVQSSGGRSAFAYPILIPLVVAALIVIGRKRASWLVVPALWPATQVHYSVLAMPATNRLLTAILAIPIPGAPAAAVLAEGAAVLWRRRRGEPSNGSLTSGS